MDPLDMLRVALRALAANKLRSVLTMLGIIIGVSAVITLLSVGDGVQQYVTSRFQGIGSSLLFVFPGRLSQQGPTSQDTASHDRPLTNEDALALADSYNVPTAKAVAMEYLGYAVATYGRETMSLQVSGVSPNYQALRQFQVQEGDFITDADDLAVSRVAVIGQTVVKTLFPSGDDPLGLTIKINQIPFKIIGILQSKGGGAFGDQDAIILVPLATAQQRLFNARGADGRYHLTTIYVQAPNDALMNTVAAEITAVLRDRHKIQFRDDDDFTVLTQSDLISAFGQITGILTVFLGAIAGISLLVGGIGIMNIMLVSVTERTREIGLRKAVGAKRRDILLQFLVEAVLLSLLGGVIGVSLGAAGALALANLQLNIPVAVTWDSVALATSVSAAIGLFFGLYPAAQASAKNPIDALRYE